MNGHATMLDRHSGVRGSVAGGYSPAQAARAIGDEARLEARQALKPGLRDYIAGLMQGVADRKRWAMNAYPKLLGLLEANDEVAEAFAALFAELRVAGREDIARMVALARSAEVVDQRQADEQCLAYARRRIRQEPAFRERFRQVILGEMTAAEVVTDAASPSGRSDLPRPASNGVAHDPAVANGPAGPSTGILGGPEMGDIDDESDGEVPGA